MSAEKLATIHAFASNSPWSLESFTQQLAQAGTILIEREHAFALGRAILDEAELLQIATHPDHQRQGLGFSVLANFERSAKANGCSRAFLEVAQDNSAAITLYSRSGWHKDGLRKGYYRLANGQREDAILMSKNL